MDNVVVIERATPADIDDLIALGCAFTAEHDGEPPDPTRVRNGMEPLVHDDRYGTIFVARRNTQLIGYAVVCWSWSVEIGGFEVVLDEVFTTERNEGIGSQLIAAVEDDCRQRGVLRIFLETERRNDQVRRLYARHGYAEDDSIWMSKLL